MTIDNATLSTIKAHRSIRQYSDKPISSEKLTHIILAAQSASSSSFMQCSSIIRITDQNIRSQFVTLTNNQQHVGKSPEFLIFCVDFYKHKVIVPEAKLGFVELTLTGAIDAGIMAQNALLAAESMGIGGVYIGAIRNNPDAVSQLLDLPEQVFPLFGLCLGYPAEQPERKPRLPISIVLHENSYHDLDKTVITEYDKIVKAYYKKRTKNKKSVSWSDTLAEKLSKESRPLMLESLRKKGLSLY